MVDMTKSQNELEDGLTNGLVQLHWKAFTSVDLLLLYKSDSNMKNSYINHLQQCPWTLVRNILLNITFEQSASTLGMQLIN